MLVPRLQCVAQLTVKYIVRFEPDGFLEGGQRTIAVSGLGAHAAQQRVAGRGWLQSDGFPRQTHSFRIIPDRGSWYEAQFDTSDLLYVYLDRKKRRRKFLTTTFFRALAFLDGEDKSGKSKKEDEKNRGTDAEILHRLLDVIAAWIADRIDAKS